MDRLQGSDLYLVDELLTEEQRMARQSVRAFVQDHFLPVVKQHFRAGTFPMDLVPRLAELGVFGASLKGTAAPGWTTSPTASSSRSWRRATAACAPSPACRARSACSPSTSSAARSRRRS